MRIEDEIKQTKFRSEYQKLSINLTFTSNWLNSNKIQFFKAHGLSPQQYNILRILKGQYPKPSSVGLLLERMLDKSSNVTRLVDKLLDKGFVSRSECKVNRRMQDILITDEGIAMLEKLQPEVDEMEKMFAVLSEEEAQKLNEMLDRIRE